jgi:hypothetical protein
MPNEPTDRAGPMQGLTNERIIEIAKATESAEPGRDGYILPISFARAIEAEVEASRQRPAAQAASAERREAATARPPSDDEPWVVSDDTGVRVTFRDEDAAWRYRNEYTDRLENPTVTHEPATPAQAASAEPTAAQLAAGALFPQVSGFATPAAPAQAAVTDGDWLALITKDFPHANFASRFTFGEVKCIVQRALAQASSAAAQASSDAGARNVTADEDRWLRNAAKGSATLIDKGKLASAAPAPAGEGAQRQAIREAIRKVTGHPDLTSGSLSLLGEIIRALAQASPAQPSGVDAQWVEKAMELAADCALNVESVRYWDAREALRTHLSTALTGAAAHRGQEPDYPLWSEPIHAAQDSIASPSPQESAAAARKDAEGVPASGAGRCPCGSALYIDAEGKPRSKAADGVAVTSKEQPCSD